MTDRYTGNHEEVVVMAAQGAVAAGAVVAQFVESMATRDMSVVGKLLAEDISYEMMTLEPPADVTVGRDKVCARIQMLLDACERVEWELLVQFEQGGTVLHERVDRFWFPEGMFPAGNMLDWPTAAHFEVSDEGLITLWRDYAHNNLNQRQLGVDLAEFGRRIGQRYAPA